MKQDYGKVTVTFGFGNGKGPTHTAASLMAGGPKHDICTESYLVQSVAGFISHTLDTANGGKGSGEDGTGKGVPIIAFTAQGCGADAAEERAPTLRAGGHRRSHANAGVVPATAFAENSHGELRFESGHGQVTGALSTGGGKPGQGCPVVLSVALRGRHGGLTAELGDDIAPTLRISSGGADKGHVLVAGYEAYFRYDPSEPDAGGWSRWRVRRLMPVECERLQGMPDDWTQVPYRGKPAADAPRYKAIGNSMAVPCMAWLGQRLLQALDKAEAHGCVLVRDAP